MIANQTLQRTPESLSVLAGAGGGAAELVVMPLWIVMAVSAF